jgi:hypothetical protein
MDSICESLDKNISWRLLICAQVYPLVHAFYARASANLVSLNRHESRSGANCGYVDWRTYTAARVEFSHAEFAVFYDISANFRDMKIC